MRLLKLHLKAFGPFTNCVLDFGDASKGLVLIHGANEAGKSSTLRAIADLRFGIHPQSKDNFVHEHHDMRVGGEFTDRHGTAYSLMRRKGRGTTLSLTNFNQEGPGEEPPAPPGIEAMLTGGLTKEAYEAMFGLDHQRLREGGRALLKGEGDVGAALFEASAGVRSVPQVLERLDTSSRKYFMPGARGKNAHINESLKTFDERHAEFKAAQVKPAQWADLLKKHDLAAAELAEVETRRAQVNAQLMSIKELRAVAPLLRAFDSAHQILTELGDVALLSANAATDRATAQAGLADALHNADMAAADEENSQVALTKLSFDPVVISLSAAINRFHASGDTIDQHRRDIATAMADVGSATASLTTLAARISNSSFVDEVLQRVPSKAERATVDQLLAQLDLAEQSVDQHAQTVRQTTNSEEPTTEALPSPEARSMLRIAQAEVARSDITLRRRLGLPGEIKALKRSADHCLSALGLSDEAALRQVRGLLGAQIDTALQQQNENTTRRDSLLTRVREISDALVTEQDQLSGLLEAGAVATLDEVTAARVHREHGWALVRFTYIDKANPSTDGYGADKPLPQAYEEAVADADRLIDALASDTERATQLQARRRAVDTLERDRNALNVQIASLALEESSRQAGWAVTLANGCLPSLTPAALRDWQALLSTAHTAFESLQAKVDEWDRSSEIEGRLASRLRSAVMATGLATVGNTVELSTLLATAAEIDGTMHARDASILKASGQAVERERQRLQSAAREAALKQALTEAKVDMKLAVHRLMLHESTPVAVIRARLEEFSDLAEMNGRLLAAQTALQRSQNVLAVLIESAKTICEMLGDAEPTDLRVYGEQIKARLDAAMAIETSRALAGQAIETAIKRRGEHVKTAERHRMSLTSLCVAAGVEREELLPGAEEQSRRRREAQSEVDKTRSQLVMASNRTREDLRASLASQDPTSMDADEASAVEELARLQEKLAASRVREEAARLALEAIDSSDTAAAAREAMEGAAASVRAKMPTWIRSKIAHSLLAESLKRFRDRAQGPMLTAASTYFEQMTSGEFVRLLSDDSGKEPVLIAQRSNSARIRVEEMSEGTRDQLFLSLRLAALDIRRASGVDLPVVLDDVLMTSDEDRSAAMLQALAQFSKGSQVIVFTHHRHISELAVEHVDGGLLSVLDLGAFER